MQDIPISAKKDDIPADRKSSIWKALVPLIVGLAIVLIPHPAGLTPKAWYFFALFAAVIVGLIMEPVPAAAIGFIGVSFAAALMMVEETPDKSVAWALRGFGNSTVWLIFCRFHARSWLRENRLGAKARITAG